MRWLLIPLLIFISCNREARPKDIVSADEMSKIVWDMMQADELSQYNSTKDTGLNLKVESFKEYEKVFSVHKISRETFYKNYRYYQEHPTLFKEMMDKVRTAAEKEKKTANPS